MFILREITTLNNFFLYFPIIISTSYEAKNDITIILSNIYRHEITTLNENLLYFIIIIIISYEIAVDITIILKT